MKHLWRTVEIAGMALGVGLGAGGCTDDETGLYIDAVLASVPPQCTLRADPSSLRRPGGRLDVQYAPTGYNAPLLVGNQLTTRGDKENLRTETSIVTITGAEVRLSDAVGAPTDEFSVPATGVLSPDSGDDPGFGIVFVPLIPASTAAALRAQLPILDTDPFVFSPPVTRVARTRVFGTTIGGLDVESAEFTYVLNVCNGCSYYVPPEGCNDPESAPEPPCDDGQDTNSDCRLYPAPR